MTAAQNWGTVSLQSGGGLGIRMSIQRRLDESETRAEPGRTTDRYSGAAGACGRTEHAGVPFQSWTNDDARTASAAARVKVVGYSIRPRGAFLIADLYLNRPLPGLVFSPRTRVARVQRSTGCTVENREGAESRVRELIRRVEHTGSLDLPYQKLSVASWCGIWVKRRKAAGKLSASREEAMLRDHLIPHLGRMALCDVTKSDALSWARTLPSHVCGGQQHNRGDPISGRTCHNIANTVRHLFKDAAKEDLIAVSPCVWDSTDLPPKVSLKAQARRAQEGGLTICEVSLLISDARIPEIRRVLYAMEFLTGLRSGEAAIRRFRDIQWDVTPRPRMVAATAWNTPHAIEKDTKTHLVRWIPVHSTLERVIRGWQCSGFARVFNRAPEPGDLIIPGVGGTTRNWPIGLPRRNSTTWRDFQADCVAVGIPPQRHYETRSTFRSLALAGGADAAMVDLITHPSIGRDARGFYNRLRLLWPRLCESVEAIRIPEPDIGNRPANPVWRA